MLTPGHFLIGAPLESHPNSEGTLCEVPLLRRWNLCQALTQHLWKRWSSKYVDQLNKFSKWHRPSRNVQVGNIVCLKGEQSAPTKWPNARVEKVFPGQDGKVRVVEVRTSKGRYNRPITSIVVLVSEDPGGL